MEFYTKKNKKIILSILFLIILIITVIIFDVQNYIQPEVLRQQILSFGIFAPFVYILLYILGTIFFVPGTVLTLIGGAIFGPLMGTVYTIIAATIGATIAFLIARYLGGSLIKRLGNTKFQKIKKYDNKIEKNGLNVVLFLRFVPFFPFNILNYALGLTKVKLSDYFFGSLFGMIPGTFVYVYLGDSLSSLNFWQIISAIILLLLFSFIATKLKNKKHD